MRTESHPADRLCDAIDRKGSPLCVGIDPVVEKLPSDLQSETPLQAVGIFCSHVIDAVADTATAVKFQSACFERFGGDGVKLLGNLRTHAKDSGLEIILDAKRGDIGITAAHYAAAVVADGPADWVTVNPYLGIDSVIPFLEAGLGVFCLVRTSNPSGDFVQAQRLDDSRTVAQSIADMLSEEGSNWIGNSGWSSVGVVVGATKPSEAIELRGRMSHQIFLMPGVGSQGATTDDVQPCLVDGHGALIPVSRSILYPQSQSGDWQSDIAHAAQSFSNALRGGANA